MESFVILEEYPHAGCSDVGSCAIRTRPVLKKVIPPVCGMWRGRRRDLPTRRRGARVRRTSHDGARSEKTARVGFLLPLATTSGRDPAGSVSTGEKRERETKRVDTTVLFRSVEGERVRRREQP